MRLRINLHRLTTPDCNTVIPYRLAWNLINYLSIKVNGELVVLVEDGTDTGVASSFTVTSDPSELDILMIDIPMLTRADTASVEIIANHTEGGDFNEDFNDDFLIEYSHKYDYANTFEVYNKDLGNNGVDITGNDDFNIYFHVTSIGDLGDTNPASPTFFQQVDFNHDFNDDFLTSCECYSNFISYRRPLTDNIYFYDSVSTTVFPETLAYSKVYRYEDYDNNVIGTMRNGNICMKRDYKIKQIVTIIHETLTAVLSEDECCDCGTTTVDRDLEIVCDTPFRNHLEMKYEWEHILSHREECYDCKDGCQSVIDQDNLVHVNMNLCPMTICDVDDLQENLYDEIRITYRVIQGSGVVLQNEIVTIDTSVVEFCYDYLASEWEYQLPDVGDFIVSVKVEFRSGDTTMIWCESNTTIRNCHWYQVEQTGCNSYRVYNHSLPVESELAGNSGNIDVNVYQLDNLGAWEFVEAVNINYLDSVELVHPNDNVYKYEIVRPISDSALTEDWAEKYIYIVINYCELRECFLKLINDLMCRQPVGKCKEEEFHQLNMLVISAHTYFSMLNAEYNFNYIYTALEPNKIADLFQLKSLMDKIRKYCKTCKDVGPCGCGCN
jgi:hypothetical protein